MNETRNVAFLPVTVLIEELAVGEVEVSKIVVDATAYFQTCNPRHIASLDREGWKDSGRARAVLDDMANMGLLPRVIELPRTHLVQVIFDQELMQQWVHEHRQDFVWYKKGWMLATSEDVSDSDEYTHWPAETWENAFWFFSGWKEGKEHLLARQSSY